MLFSLQWKQRTQSNQILLKLAMANPVFIKQDKILNPFNGVDVGAFASPVFGDLNGDGEDDVLIGNQPGKLQSFRKDGDGFTKEKSTDNPLNGVDVGSNAAPAMGDLDGDGDEDVFIGNSKGILEYFRNDGDSFSEQKGADNPFNGVAVGANATPTRVDLDGDGDEDVLIGNSYGTLQYFRNDEDSFTEVTGSENPFEGINIGAAISPTIFDGDGDGDEDVILGNQKGKLKYFRNDGGSFTQQKGDDNPFQGIKVGKAAAPTVFEIDDDGDKDLLVGNEKGQLKYLENLTIDVNDPPIATNESIGIADNNPTTIDVLKNDADPEGEAISLIEFAANTTGGTVERDENETPEDLTDDQLIYTPPTDFSPNESDSFTYTIADPNNQTATATVNVFAIPIFVERDNELNPFNDIDVGGYANPAFGDLDGDNDLDLLIGDDHRSIQYFRNDAGTFTEVSGSDNPFDGMDIAREPSLVINDLDGDGDGDVLVGDEYGNLKYFRNYSGTFVQITGTDNPFEDINVSRDASPALGDLDGDGDNDLLVGDFFGDLSYFRNDGGEFIELTGNNNPFRGINVSRDASPTIVDLNGDGNDDVVIGNDFGKLKYFQNDQGTFSQLKGDKPFKELDGGEEASPVMIDLDGDGDDDLIVGVVDGTLKYFENNPLQTFSSNTEVETFVLGDSTESFYDNKGNEDYSLIENFDSSQDIIQLKGTAAEYQLGTSPSGLPEGTAIFLNGTELMGIVQGVDDLTFESDSFIFV
ncbi:MAG: VCBS repeat-containing protein [Gomphosphaeria aponina SAG 52.96 = DSM 107014]|uniref:VCBS repeat-containing protein n=1 Tax=Gomphosphaeria aponina SAG 52.96 = DSM 107014 TaxID=1521640 RepID=A0A941GU37_9CHRO|nr:VCBS repeat-containing protein [Gomphosphaeria aponina SAG 52.96 = DSM 107014]